MNFRILLGERGALSCLTKCEMIYKIGRGSPEAAARGGGAKGYMHTTLGLIFQESAAINFLVCTKMRILQIFFVL